MAKNRDDFPPKVIKTLERRVNGKCSNPNHRVPTSGPKENTSEANCIGIAAHIAAAAPGGPRYDPSMTAEERKNINNAIWLCSNCSIMIDKDPQKYTVELLKQWKQVAEQEALEEMGNVPVSRKAHEQLQAVVFGELPTGRVRDAVATICRLSEKALGDLDPRFSIDVAHSAGMTTYRFSAKEPVSVSLEVANNFTQEFRDKYAALLNHGKDLEIDSKAISLKGSKLLELSSGGAGKFVISTNFRKEAVTKIYILNSNGEPAYSFDDVQGTLVGGRKSITFSGSTFRGLFDLEFSYPLDHDLQASCTTKTGLDYSAWSGKTLLNLPYFEKIYRFYEALYQGKLIKLALEIDGTEVLSGIGKKIIEFQDLKKIYPVLRYIRNVRGILRAIGTDVPYVHNVFIPEEDVEEVEYIYYLINEYSKLRGKEIGQLALTVTPHDSQDAMSGFESLLSSAGGGIRIEQSLEQPLNLFGTKLMLPRLAMSYSKMRGANNMNIKAIKPGESISLKLDPLEECAVHVELCRSQ